MSNTLTMKSKLVTHKNILIANGYLPPPHYVGLLNNMPLYCGNCQGMTHQTLYVKEQYDEKYVCGNCNCSVEYVG